MHFQIVCPCGFRSNARQLDECSVRGGSAVPVFVPGCTTLERVVVVQGDDEPNEEFDALIDERAARMARERFGETAIPMGNLDDPLACPECGRLEAKYAFVGF